MREKSGKKGHVRQISRQLIKRKLMQDLYPIPRQRQPTSRLKMKSSLNIKFANTLQFMEHNQIEVLMLHKFQERLANQLNLSVALLDASCEYLKIDNNLYQLIKKLVTMSQRKEQSNESHIIYQLKNFAATASEAIRQTVSLLLFYRFMCVNIDEYNRIMKEFQQKKIFDLISSVHFQRSQLLASKILSAVFIIFVKYNQTMKIWKCGQRVIRFRRIIESEYKHRQELKIDEQHRRLTLLFSVKYIEASIKHSPSPYEIMDHIQSQLDFIEKEKHNGSIGKEVIQLYLEEIDKLKKHAFSKIQEDFYRNSRSLQKFAHNENREKVEYAIRQLKRCKSINILSKHGSLESKVSISNDKNASVKEPDNFFKEVYNPKSIKQFSKLTSQRHLKKGRKLMKSTITYQQQKPQQPLLHNNSIKSVTEPSKPNAENKSKTKQRDKQGNPTLFMKLSNLYQLTNKRGCQPNQKTTKNEKLEKKRKIDEIYCNFSNLNKIVREIPRKQLERQFINFRSLQIGTKILVKEMMVSQIISFSAGLQNGNYEISSILNNKGCLQLQFVKVWLNCSFVISIKIQVQDELFILKVALNGKKYSIKLSRGSNVLCERYVTIWPTIRYLVNKKLYQYSIFKRYQSLLLIKKMAQANLIQLQSQIYLEKFGFISKEEIQEINICLDSVFKIILISKQYYGKYYHSKPVKINEEINFPYLLTFDKEDAHTMKLNLLSQIYLLNNQRVSIVSYMCNLTDKYFLIKIFTSREKLINIIKNKEALDIYIEITSLQTLRSKSQGKIGLQWHDLQRNLIIYDDFKRYIIEICLQRGRNQNFALRLIKYFSKRLVIKYHPIFMWECKFTRDVYSKPKTKTKESDVEQELDNHFQRHRTETVESYCDNINIASKDVQVNIRQSNQSGLKRSIDKQPKFCKLKSKKEIHPPVRKIPKQGKKNSNGMSKRQIWKQQKRINGKEYLIKIDIIEEKVGYEWIAEFTVINRRSEVKHLLRLNHLDLFQIYQRDLMGESQENQGSDSCGIKTYIRQHKNSLLVQLINSASFYHNYQLSKIFLQKGGKHYRHNFRQQKLEKQLAKRRETRNTNTFKLHPLLQSFSLYCNLRIVKPIKVQSKFGFLTLKQNFIQEQSFWQIILQFPRRNTHYVYQLKQQQMTFYISDHRRKKNQNPTQKKIEQDIYIPSFTLQDHLSITTFEPAQQEDVINFKTRIINLISAKEIQVLQSDNKYILSVCLDQYQLRERIIQQYDSQSCALYNVWVDNETIEVELFIDGSEFDESNSSVSQSYFLNFFKREVIGYIELSAAKRFYEMENKDTNQEDFYLKRVCQFYFDFVKQQRRKYAKIHQKRIVEQFVE